MPSTAVRTARWRSGHGSPGTSTTASGSRAAIATANRREPVAPGTSVLMATCSPAADSASVQRPIVVGVSSCRQTTSQSWPVTASTCGSIPFTRPARFQVRTRATDAKLPAMPTRIEIRELRSLMDRGAQLVEVLPREEYDEEHLPGAVNIPVKELDAETTARLDKRNPLIVYCSDYL